MQNSTVTPVHYLLQLEEISHIKTRFSPYPCRLWNQSSFNSYKCQVTSDDDNQIYTRISNIHSYFQTFSSNDQLNDTYQTLTPLHSKNSSTITKPVTASSSTSVIYTAEPV